MPILQRLQWGKLSFANLRYNNSDHSLAWNCEVGMLARGEKWAQFDCDEFVGNHLRPGNYKPRSESHNSVHTRPDPGKSGQG